MKENAYQYLRVSGKGQIDRDGFNRQRDVCSFYANQHDIEIIGEFVEKGVSGTTDAYDREALTALFEAIKANGVRLVLVETPSRIARDLMISEILLGEFRKLGVRVISAECGTELTTQDGDITKTLIRQVLGAISQWEKSMLVSKLRMARTRIRKSGGRCEGRKPYGVNDDEKAIIARIIDLKGSGVKPAAIAGCLNTENIKPRGAKRAGRDTAWHPVMIYRILERHNFNANGALNPT